MSQAGASLAHPSDSQVPSGTLRADMERRRALGQRYSLREMVAIVVPLCSELMDRHTRGEKFFVNASSIEFVVGRPTALLPHAAQQAPVLPRDRACIAPEARAGVGGDVRSSVFSIGALCYEMLTGVPIGPGMRRPSELVPGLGDHVDQILSRALIGDPQHRPADLGALAQALHHLAPTASQAPPPADESALDGDEELIVDVSLSMLPPAPPPVGSVSLPRPPPVPQHLFEESGLVEVTELPQQPNPADPTATLADLKARLEADPRPRYVVIKDGMDHGPFTAIELLQQIASHTFESQHILVDSFSNDERPITDWEEFAPFANHARLNREIVAEKKEIERVVVAESKATRSKALIIGFSLAAVASLATVAWFVAKPRVRQGELVLDNALAVNIETDAGIKSGADKVAGARMTGGGAAPADGVNRPVLRGGMSCEQAMDTYVTELKMSGNAPDLSSGSFGAVLNRGDYLGSCGTPSSMTVNICAAVQNGRAVGVTVSTSPPNAGVSSCIAGRVRGLSFPSSPRLDVTHTVFKGE